MKKIDNKRGGQPITGWRRGQKIQSVADVAVDDVLVMDSKQFHATNLIRVKSLRRFPTEDNPVSGFYYRYVTPDLSQESSGGSADTMLAWHWEVACGEFFRAKAKAGNKVGKQYEIEKQALEENNRRWA